VTIDIRSISIIEKIGRVQSGNYLKIIDCRSALNNLTFSMKINLTPHFDHILARWVNCGQRNIGAIHEKDMLWIFSLGRGYCYGKRSATANETVGNGELGG
jgi:hypothetical protein